ncbi:hypothetical protein F5Y01DRAFT_257598 [Xylaria sp. FL0043]|nr:hypothetical protein F5Y01DRAFT_257598 [Xylaria sp. FL0043]
MRNCCPLVVLQEEENDVLSGTCPGSGFRSAEIWNFKPENTGFLTYNKTLVKLMGRARTASLKATDSRQKKDHEGRWRTFLFIFACATVHQLAGFFTAYLSQGRTYPVANENEVGGHWLECILYGGSLETYQWRGAAPTDPITLYFRGHSNKIRGHIDLETITAFLNDPQQLQLPPIIVEDLTDKSIKRRGLQKMASTTPF